MTDRKLKSLDLFSGIGGLTYSLSDVCDPVAYCEIDNNCQRLLRHNMDRGYLPRAPIFSDVTVIGTKGFEVQEPFDIVVGGSPCVDF